MPRRNDPKDAPADFDDLLAEEVPDVVEESTPDAEEAEPELTPAQKRLADARARAAELDALPEEEDPYRGLNAEEIAELELIEARIARADAVHAPVVDEVELSPEEKAEQDLIARRNNERIVADEKAPTRYDNSRIGGTGEKILFHVVTDGFNAFGDIWYRGQEIEVEVGTPSYKRTFDSLGDSWLNIIGDEHAQYERWGRRMVAPGEFRPLPGEKFEDELVSVDRRRGRTVPVVSI